MPGILTLSELFSVMTRDEVLETILEVAEDVGLKITAWQPGQPSRSLFAIVSQRVADFTSTTSEAIKGGLLDYATGGWLTLHAYGVYRVTRIAARYATGDTITITNTSDETYPVQPGDFRIAHSVTGATYVNTELLSIAPGTTEDVEVIAENAGTGSNAAPGTITEVVSALTGVSVTNVGAVLGSDEESDEELRQRCRDKLASLSPNGPKDAYSYVVKDPILSPTAVPITRVRVDANDASGEVIVYLATSLGAPSGADVDIAQEAIDLWAEPWCVIATAIGADDLVIPITCTVWVRGSSATVAQIQSAVNVALTAYFRTIEIGGEVIDEDDPGRVDVDALKAVIFGATPGVKDVEIATPAADVDMAVNEVAQLGALVVNVNILT